MRFPTYPKRVIREIWEERSTNDQNSQENMVSQNYSSIWIDVIHLSQLVRSETEFVEEFSCSDTKGEK